MLVLALCDFFFSWTVLGRWANFACSLQIKLYVTASKGVVCLLLLHPLGRTLSIFRIKRVITHQHNFWIEFFQMHFATVCTYVPYFQRKVHTDKCFKSNRWKLTSVEVLLEIIKAEVLGKTQQMGTAEVNCEGWQGGKVLTRQMRARVFWMVFGLANKSVNVFSHRIKRHIFHFYQ